MVVLRPPVRRGMKELDKGAFTQAFPVVGLSVPTKSIGQIQKELSKDLLRMPRLRSVVDGSSSSTTHKIVLLNPEINDKLEGASERLRQLVQENKWETVEHTINLGYEHWGADEVLKAILPDPSQAPTSYEQIGHIAHMNLRDEYLEYKALIGQVILDKSTTVKTVVNKLDTIDNTFRNFKMEVLAGEDNFVATVRENECMFRFDYSKVYWNSRLHSEHERLIKMFGSGSSICDVMAGVGPFAIPAAKQGALVWANDLNPASFNALCDNVRLNKVQARVRTFNKDGRDFIRKAFAEYYQMSKNGTLSIPPNPKKSTASKNIAAKEQAIPITSRSFDHVVMNLPAIAIEFLDAFRGIFRHIAGEDDKPPNLPLIHVHCFTKSEEPKKDILLRACRALGFPEDKHTELDADVYYVRKVAPKKDMYCLSLRLPESVAYAATPT
ncbi:tRNA(m(1)G37)methyltransferase [Coemansia guatemalensis]|uniref:tRNA (guanine(37)-N1)-methyltransferase n=1 Tax=Coemansia guatemalensis TaxID=2761395 RepID=A0A9W8LSW3_9FUNG|nr:tRNA(m(1)G37)methyltransferase [Coemansia guatemalensis]